MLLIIQTFVIAAAIQLAAMLCLGLAERAAPTALPQQRGVTQNIGIGAMGLAAQTLGKLWFAPFTVLAINQVHGGLVVLPASGFGLIVGIAIYVVAMDFGEYLFHSAQHAVPFLWAMHALHHSDTSFGATTAVRHFWLESWIKSATIWLAVGMMFQAPPLAMLAYGVLGLYNFVSHSNLRINFGRASWLCNSPAYHRLHHSASPDHADCNYAALLPIFDWLSGAYLRPAPGMYPVTGLGDGRRPHSVLQAAVWPLLRQAA
jgi:sterol desaturase/sphingolipid hydroxylase (fatty acid hydroxylase superfamily)